MCYNLPCRMPIPHYKGQYAANCKGEIISLARISPQLHQLKEKILRPTKTSRGYFIVTLCKKAKLRYYSVHRLVALAYFGGSKLEVNHKNGIKTDNRPSNLEYVTRQENVNHAKKNKLFYFSGKDNPNYRHGLAYDKAHIAKLARERYKRLK